ncbi:sodium/solute symporter [Streptomyces sp. S465]|uniref:sodium/solute symporter n=1 Tax=Streptomyces sp. S465 TaxID=2979468 RepID=UPI0022A8BA07|nr:cation acetate symporter [Streptomyces sp. S465]WAP59909.1 cation acetate symporter [Streptomyces sp. S465]
MSSVDPRTLAFVLFAGFTAVSFLLCILAATGHDDPTEFYLGTGTLSPMQNGLAIAGDYISAATVLSTTGTIAMAGFDGVLIASSTVLSLLLFMLVLAGPLCGRGQFTLGDVLSERLGAHSVRTGTAVVVLAVTMPLLLVQLNGAGAMMALLLGIPGSGAVTGCTVFIGSLMVCYAALGGMKGTGFIQILKTVLLFAAFVLLACLVLRRFSWNPATLFDAAADAGGHGGGFWRSGGQYGDSLSGRLEIISVQLTLVLGAACMPHLTMRLHPIRGVRAARAATAWAVGAVTTILGLIVIAGAGATAIVGARALRASDPTGSDALLLLTLALDPAAQSAHRSLLFSVVACAVVATTLAAVAGLTLAAAASLAHDVLAKAVFKGGLSANRELAAARAAIVAVGVVAVVLAIATQHWNRHVLISFTFAAAASALLPVVLYGTLWRGFTVRGLRWALYGGLVLTALAMAFSPAISGDPLAVFPERDFHWFPLRNPGLITIPAGFLLGRLGSRTGRRTRHSPDPARGDAPHAVHTG